MDEQKTKTHLKKKNQLGETSLKHTWSKVSHGLQDHFPAWSNTVLNPHPTLTRPAQSLSTARKGQITATTLHQKNIPWDQVNTKYKIFQFSM